MNMRNDSNTRTNWGMGAALGAALGASACCTIPLALVSLGVGGAWIGSLTALAPYRGVFAGFALTTLGYAGYNEWRLSRRPDCNCDTVLSSPTRRTLLGTGALAVVLLIGSPWVVGGGSPASSHHAPTAGTESMGGFSEPERESGPPASFRQVVLEVEGMTCKTCPVTVRRALRAVKGVYSAKTTFKPPQAVVRFDPETTSVETLTRATRDAGFPSRPKRNS